MLKNGGGAYRIAFLFYNPIKLIVLLILLLCPLLTSKLTAVAQQVLPNTSPLQSKGEMGAQMVDSINLFLLQKTEEAVKERAKLWNRDYRSVDDYNRSISPNRERFRKIIGAVDPRVDVKALELEATTSFPAQISEGAGYKVFAVRWQVLDGVTAEGLLLEPNEPPLARIVAIPDADWSPEMLVGLHPGIPPTAQFARRLAENGCQVLVPVLIDRSDTWSGSKDIRMTNQPHREFIYRMAFEVGRHIIGYEVQKVLAAVDWFTHENERQSAPIGVIGYGEGGLLALYSGALDTRISATLVCGYFQSRQELWKEPIYRDVWGLLREFGDAELASLISPRTLIVEASRAPQVDGPPVETAERKGAAPSGKLFTPSFMSVEEEVKRARPFFTALSVENHLQLISDNRGNEPPGSDASLVAFLRSLGISKELHASQKQPNDARLNFDPGDRLHGQFDQLVAFTQLLVRQSPERRAEFWSKADASSPERWKETTEFYRNYIWDEVIGRLTSPKIPLNPRTRLIFDKPKYRGYEVLLDVGQNVFAYGILLVPKNIKLGERRPVVVCQHGLEGQPRDVADPNIDSHYYHAFAVRLAEEGFITYAPQNPYIGGDRFRLIQRKAHPLKLSLFSFILWQHERTLDWLSEQPFVDPKRIGFYGLSYGGKTAVRVPPLLKRYALSICSGDFNEWVWKTTTLNNPYSYLFYQEYEIVEFNLANIANYSELASLMAPRPFMVERGHQDTVAPDEWVAFEYAKLRNFYVTKMRMPDMTEIEFFNGPHTIHLKGTLEFLRRHLQWPEQTGK